MNDLVHLALTTRMERRKLTRAEIQRRWVARNRAYWLAYRREWRQQRREKGLRVT